MSDAYEDRDYNYDDDSGGRKRRRRYMRYEDDAWGAAYQGDFEDGDEADFDEWAGMVPEEASSYPPSINDYGGHDVWIDEPGGNVNRQVPYRGQDPLAAARRTGDRAAPNEDLNTPSPALERAGRLLNRYDRRRLTKEGRIEIEGAKREQQGDFIDSLFNFRFEDMFGGGGIQQIAVVVLIVLVIASLSCIAAAWFTAIEVREAMGLTEFIIRP